MLGTFLSHRSEELSYYVECLLRASHRDVRASCGCEPIEEFKQIAAGRRKSADLFVPLPAFGLGNQAGDNHFLVDVDATTALVEQFHVFLFTGFLRCIQGGTR